MYLVLQHAEYEGGVKVMSLVLWWFGFSCLDVFMCLGIWVT